MRTFRFTAIVWLVVLPISTASGQSTASQSMEMRLALNAIRAVSADSTKLEAFCEMAKLMSADPDIPKTDESFERVDHLMHFLGDDFQSAWNLGAELELGSPDEELYVDEITKLKSKCGR